MFLYNDSGWRPVVISNILGDGGNVEDGELQFQESIILLDRKIRAGNLNKNTSLKTQFTTIAKQCWRNNKTTEIAIIEPKEQIIANNIRNQFKLIRAEHEIPVEKPPFLSKYSWLIWSIILVILGVGSYFIIKRSDFNSTTDQLNPAIEKDSSGRKQDSIKNTKLKNIKQPITKSDKGISPISPQRKAKLLAVAKEFYKSPQIDALRSDNLTPDDPITKAQKAWADHDLKKVIIILETIDEKNPRYINSQLLLGHAYYQTKEYQKAKYSFNLVKQKNIMPYAEEAEWNILITLVAQHKVRSPYFKRHIDKFINNTGSTYNIEAIALAQRIK